MSPKSIEGFHIDTDNIYSHTYVCVCVFMYMYICTWYMRVRIISGTEKTGKEVLFEIVF